MADSSTPSTTVALGCDHAGLDMKNALIPVLDDFGLTALDVGTYSTDSVDYPDFADRLAEALADGRATRGILVCGSGIGISIAANRHRHIRAALCHNSTEARLSRLHNDANVIALGARTIGPEVALECVRTFLTTDFEGGRHARRVGKLSPAATED
ncbi:ribose 5-phosphate isomerase B [Rhodospirillaceae bacterium KN72]|uniref:Ribose 5-phosphate isomerase B n=1 Tax=Pacificispira spongiicola TaxID=2729598 RepID=A0A7Y0E2K3_9PROT|nr:ribose 5-phosphate isomerase B [Pacificispira spongiicola]NMM46008.1 ribose 5-phosphate isomerase B [Pacificispira spongiicola]